MKSLHEHRQPDNSGRPWTLQMQQPRDTEDRLKEKEKDAKATDILQEHIRRPYYFTDVDNQQDWQRLPEIPSGEEILRSVPDSDLPENPIPRNKTSPKPWKDKSTYLAAQYRLLREDAIRPLKIACREFMAAPDLGDSHQTSIYTHVYIRGYTFAPAGAAAKIEFSTERAGKRIRWSQTKRLQQGTIVALSPHKDNFRTTCKVAVIAARALTDVELDPPRVDIYWSSPENAEFDPTERYVMIESKSGYFEASRHMLVAFQKSMSEAFPLSEHLVGVKQDIDAPESLKSQPLMDLESLQMRPVGLPHADGAEDLSNINVLERFPDVTGGSLDKSQLKAVRRILTKKVAIVQGPPGTGKTFVSIAALVVMLRNWSIGDPPIIVSAQTNHALDQLLTKIAFFDKNILRLGGRAKEDDELIQSLTLYTKRKEARRYLCDLDHARQAAANRLKRLSDVMIADIDKMNSQPRNEAKLFFELGLITKAQYKSISDDGWTRSEEDVSDLKPWLKTQHGPPGFASPLGDRFDEEEDAEYEALDEQEMEARRARDDDDLEALRGRYYPYHRNFVGRYKTELPLMTQVPRILSRFTNLEDVPDDWRGAVYEYLKNEASKKIRASFREHLKLYTHLTQDLKIARWEQNVKLIRSLNIKLIGCTTTGLSIYRGVIAALEPRTLLIEEAAETLEGTVVAGMFESLEQLILVGDHEQLQAHCNVSSLAAAPYNLAISLFQRLVENGLEYTMLNTQRRMTPQLSKLLGGVYEGLKDHPSVHGRPDVWGMGGRNSYFFMHDCEESLDETLSRYNIEEAQMVAGFFNYLVLNGVNPSHITVLTFYNGQRKKILKFLKEKPSLKNGAPLNVFTVDSYQGEENEIVLLSLVRSNHYGSVGFLENRNRAVVALSRARRGQYIFGDLLTLLSNREMESFPLWNFAREIMWEREELLRPQDLGMADTDGGVLPLVCQKHGNEVFVTRARDLDDRGGCDEMCGEIMRCGHVCQSTCHWLTHDDMVCKQQCTKRIEDCAKGHTCVMACFQRCSCPCPEAELLQRPAPIVRSDTDASAVRRMIMHGLGMSRSAMAGPSMRPTKVQAFGNPMAYRPKPSVRQQHQGINGHRLHGRSMAPGPPVLTETYRPMSGTANGQQSGPSIISHYDRNSMLPLTPNAVASHASAAAPSAPSMMANRPPPASQPIVEVTTRNQVNGQLSRHAINPQCQPIGLFTTAPQFTAARPAPQPPTSNVMQGASGPAPWMTRPEVRLSNGYAHTVWGHAYRNGGNENLPVRATPPNVSIKEPSAAARANETRPRQGPSSTMKLFLKGLPYAYKRADLFTLFGLYGDVFDPQIHRRHDGRPAGSGSIIMMRDDAQRAIRGLKGKPIGNLILEVAEYRDELYGKRTPSPRGRSAPPSRRRRAKSLGSLRAATRLARATSAPPDLPEKRDANSWPRNATAVAEAGAVPFIPELPQAPEPPPGELRSPSIEQELLANRTRPAADGMETVCESTIGGTIVGRKSNSRVWQPMTGMREVLEEVSPALDEDLIDLGDGEDIKPDDEKISSMTFTGAMRPVRPRAPPKRLVSLLDD